MLNAPLRLMFAVTATLVYCGATLAQAPTPRLQYDLKPGIQHHYEFKVEIDSDGKKTTTSGNINYQLKGANVTNDLSGDQLGASEEGEATSTAFVVTPDGYLLTCAHCVKGAKTINCVIGDKTLEAKLIDINHDEDLAIIKVDGKDLPTVQLGKNTVVQLAQDVRAIGYPLSDVLGSSVKVTRGSVAGLINNERGKSIQVDAAVNSGNSGGPLVDDTGAVIGVVSAKLTGATISKVGFAVPIPQACAMLDRNKVNYRTSESTAVLSGVQIAKQITPAVAFVTAEIGPGGQGNDNFHISSSGAMTTVSPSKRDRRETILSEVIITKNGESLDKKEDTNLPFFFGPACMMPFETLPSYASKQWSDDANLILPLPKSLPKNQSPDRFSPFGPSFGGRFPSGFRGSFPPTMPHIPSSPFDRGFGRRGSQPAEAKPEMRMAIGSRSIRYQIESIDGDMVTISREMELKTIDDKDDFSSLRIANKGTLVFNRQLGLFVSKTVRGDFRIRLGKENVKIPCELTYQHNSHQNAGNPAMAIAAPVDGIKPIAPNAPVEAKNHIESFLNLRVPTASAQNVVPMIATLTTCEVDDAKRDEVTKRLEIYLKRNPPLAPKKSVIDALLNWNPKAATPYVIAEFRKASVFSKRSWLSRLARTGQSDAAKLLCVELANARTRSAAIMSLEQMGEPAESMVLLRLKTSKDDSITKACLEVLKKIGTDAAINVIEECSEKPRWPRVSANQTISAIKIRGN